MPSVSELKSVLRARGISFDGILEKQELEDLVSAGSAPRPYPAASCNGGSSGGEDCAHLLSADALSPMGDDDAFDLDGYLGGGAAFELDGIELGGAPPHQTRGSSSNGA
eukprot:3381257-Prymnesium_polylepis.1